MDGQMIKFALASLPLLAAALAANAQVKNFVPVTEQMLENPAPTTG